MEIIHNFDKNSIRKDAGDTGQSLMLARDGSYLWVGAKPASRYQGWFFALGNGRPVKIIDDIRPIKRTAITSLANGTVSVQRSGPGVSEKFSMPQGNCLAYELDKFTALEITFDIKDPYESPEFGRNYRVWKEDGAIIVSFRQDSSGLPEIFAAVWGDFGIIEIEEEWIKRDYRLDRSRNDLPAERWVFKPARVSASKIVVAAGVTKEDAFSAALSVWKTMQKEILGPIEKIGGAAEVKEADAAKSAAVNSLKMLFFKDNGYLALRAGLPWFFQQWRRDAAVSLLGLFLVDQKAAEEMLFNLLDDLETSGYKFGDSADAVGWLFLRAGEFIKAEMADGTQKQKVANALKRTIEKLMLDDAKGSLAVSGNKQTWMDSLPRAGAAIELQALRLNMYSLAAVLAQDEDEKTYYQGLEAAAWVSVRDKFFHGGKLADIFDPVSGKADRRWRPNVFLAAYAYPELLNKGEWEEIFDNALEALWLDWGGLATVDKSDPEFCGDDSGADPAAYHNGDSWFWVNNIAAIVLARSGRKKYREHIDKIFAASINDILWNGAAGCASEISPATIYAPAGCVNQAWSNATFLELWMELKGL